jgi:hypothetical protein
MGNARRGRNVPRACRPVDPVGEKGRSALELTWAWPTAEFNGIIGGWHGQGLKTVTPRKPGEVSFRLVPTGTEKIRAAFQAFVKRIPPIVRSNSIRMAARRRSSFPTTRRSRPRPRMLSDRPKPVTTGGSIPVVGDFQTYLGMESLVGFTPMTIASIRPTENTR